MTTVPQRYRQTDGWKDRTDNTSLAIPCFALCAHAINDKKTEIKIIAVKTKTDNDEDAADTAAAAAEDDEMIEIIEKPEQHEASRNQSLL